MADKEIAITYETLFELLRRERDRTDIQKLSETFYDDVLHYLQEKLDVIDKLQSETETIKTKKQIENIKNMLTELYERREKKILDMAMNRSRIDKESVDISVLLDNEKEFFKNIVTLLSANRKEVLENVLATEMKKDDFVIPKKDEEEKEFPEKEEPISNEAAEKEESEKTKMVQFLHPVPSFIGKNLESYGPYDEKETAELPIEIAKILITKGRASEIRKDL